MDLSLFEEFRFDWELAGKAARTPETKSQIRHSDRGISTLQDGGCFSSGLASIVRSRKSQGLRSKVWTLTASVCVQVPRNVVRPLGQETDANLLAETCLSHLGRSLA